MKQPEQSLPPWARGPFELIRHASEHLKMEGDTDKRIALIGFDNAIEVCIDVFLSLHPKVREGIEISRDDAERARKNYHTKLEFFYTFVDERKIPIQVSMKDVIWYHQLRNELYHSGNGLTPDKYIVEGSQAAAVVIFNTLFKFNAPDLFKNQQSEDNGIKIINGLLGVDVDNTELKVASQPPRDARVIREILKTQGHLLLMKNPFTGRIARICQMPDGNYGAQIVKWDLTTNEWREATSFSDRQGNLEKFIKYFWYAGYVENGGDLPKPFPTQ